MLLTGLAPFGIHDQTEVPRIIGFATVVVAIGLSIVTCLKGSTSQLEVLRHRLADLLGGHHDDISSA
jgi:hypothetical protein